jgi:TetR/AcrR family transcriptional regulator
VQAAKIFKEIPDPSSVNRILAAAEALFAEQGFDAVSMSAIAEKAEVSKANIFHHFSSKNALYLAVFGSACRESRTRLDLLESNVGNFVERLSHFATGHLQAILEHSNMARLVLRDLLENGADKGKELAEQVFGPNFAKLVEIIRNGQARGELRTDVDPAMVAVMLIAANVYFFEARDMLRHFPDVDFADKPEHYSAKMLQLMLHGILPASKEKNS